MSSIHSIESEGSVASLNNAEVKICGNFPDSLSLVYFIYTAFNISKQWTAIWENAHVKTY